MIKIKEELQEWLSNHITETIHNLKSEESEAFNKWAESYPKEVVETIVGAEFINDWGYDEREEVSEEEATEYAQAIIQRILSSWN